jgi:hypothetical protein
MASVIILAGLCLAFTSAPAAPASEGHILKVLPQYLDKKGLTALTPSLYDRDAYQAELRKHPEMRSGFRFAIQWKARTPETKPLTLRVELFGTPLKTETPSKNSLELVVHQKHWFSHWAFVTIGQQDYKAYGEITAWRVTLWDGDRMLDEQKSFLWQNIPTPVATAAH